MAKSIGIDLGTTYSLVATVLDGEASILKRNVDGRIPSVLLFRVVLQYIMGDSMTLASLPRWKRLRYFTPLFPSIGKGV